MALTIESLKGLYEKLGGTNFGDVTTIPEAIDKISEVAEGGGGDEYETVAEIAVGTMTKQGGMYGYDIPSAEKPDMPAGSDALFFNTSDYPLTWIETGTTYAFNFSDEGEPSGSPAYALTLDGSDAIFIMSDTDLSNTTVRILKKVSGGGGSVTVDSELSETSENPVQNKVITAALADKMDVSNAPLVITGTTSGSTFTQTSSVTAEQIRDAIAAHRPIYIEDATMRLYYNYGGYTAADSFSYGFVGSLYDDTMNKRNDIFVVFEDSMATATMFNLKFSPDA